MEPLTELTRTEDYFDLDQPLHDEARIYYLDISYEGMSHSRYLIERDIRNLREEIRKIAAEPGMHAKVIDMVLTYIEDIINGAENLITLLTARGLADSYQYLQRVLNSELMNSEIAREDIQQRSYLLRKFISEMVDDV